MTDPDAFFRIHHGLPREGPGDPADPARVAALAGLSPGARIADMGCGPGGDVAGILDAFPGSHVTAVDLHAPYAAAVQARFAGSSRVEVVAGDMAAVAGPFDLIWTMGALYFPGLREGLAAMRGKLAPGGVIAFSHPAYFADTPSAAARAFWKGYETEQARAVLAAAGVAGFGIVDHWPVGDEGWASYYEPLLARIAMLLTGADEGFAAVLEAEAAEAAAWARVKDETGYLMVVARRDDG